MGIKEIVAKNKEFNDWRKGLEEEIKAKKEELELFNKSEFDIEEFKKLAYNEAKEVFEEIKYNLEYNTQRKQVEEALKNIKENTYKILKAAHYFPAINDLEYLTTPEKNLIDSFLYMVKKGGYIHTGSTGWYKIRLSKEKEEKLFNDLYEKGIIERCYQLNCSRCGDWSEVISEERYLNNKKMFEIFDKQRKQKATEEELQWCEDLMEKGERIWEISCMECDEEYQEVDKFEQLESRAKVIYKVKADADLTYARL